MIFAFTGKTGSGKTYQMVKEIYARWKTGTDVYSNTYLLFEKYERFKFYEVWLYNIQKFFLNLLKRNVEPQKRGRIIYYEDISEIIEARNGIILMDEGQNLLEARNWENLPAEFSNKLRQHRKHRLDLYVTTQNLGTIDINLRRLVQKWKHTRDVFALFGKRNPNIFSIHITEEKDIDELYNNVDDLLVNSLSHSTFFIHLWKKKLYDTMYDIGFTTLKSVWLQENEKTKLLIIPKKWKLENARTQQLLLKFYLNPTKLIYSKKDWKN